MKKKLGMGGVTNKKAPMIKTKKVSHPTHAPKQSKRQCACAGTLDADTRGFN